MFFRNKKTVVFYIRKSFSLIELATYIAVIGVCTSMAVGGMSILKNARVQKAVSELYFYENAISDFVIKYGEFPGNMSLQRCLMFNEFREFCEVPSNPDTIAPTTTLPTLKQLSIVMTDANIDDQIIALNFGRFLKTSGLLETIKIGINEASQIADNKDVRIKNYLPKIGIGDDVYMHYMYNNQSHKWNDYFIYTGGIGTNFFSFSNDTENALIIIFSTLGRYIDVNRGGAFSADFMQRIDKKIDDGRPRTGFLVGLPQGADGQDVSSTCDNDNVYYADQDDLNLNIRYLNDSDVKNGCNLAYLSSIDFTEMLAN